MMQLQSRGSIMLTVLVLAGCAGARGARPAAVGAEPRQASARDTAGAATPFPALQAATEHMTCQRLILGPEAGAPRGSVRWAFVVGDPNLPSRRLWLELDSTRALAGVFEIAFRGTISKGGRMETAAVLFGPGRADGRVIYESAAAADGGAATEPTLMIRSLTPAELERARLIAEDLLTRGCKSGDDPGDEAH